MPDLARVPLDELLALRAVVLKYNPDQPREPAGDPAGGEFISVMPLGEAMDAWEAGGSDGPHEIRASIAAALPSPAAHALLTALAKQKDGNAPTLYRGARIQSSDLASELGITVSQADFYDKDHGYAPVASHAVPFEAGKTFDLNLSSFTSTLGYGAAFATGYADDAPKPGQVSVLFTLDGGTALKMSGKSGDDPGGSPRTLEREWLTGGTFSVTNARVNDIAYTVPISGERGREPQLQVFIKQEAKLAG